MKKWQVLNSYEFQITNFKLDKLVDIILENRGLKSKKEIAKFLHPKLEEVTISEVEIDKKQLKISLQRIQTAIRQKEQVVVFGDYDVDGICGTAILWETLQKLHANAMPYIPHRLEEGYGLSEKGIENVLILYPDTKIIITVDNGIVANAAVSFANKKGIDVIITDHHVPGKKLPDAFSIVHTTKLCGTAVAWVLAQELKIDKEENHLELVALATIADLVPLTDTSRILTIFGLKQIRKTKRVGILELCKEAAIDPATIDVYKIGHMIAPRINAMGRLEYAMEALRLLCTNNAKRAEELAQKLGTTNKERQGLTEETVLHAKALVSASVKKKLLFIVHESYQQGVIGLVAGRLVEEFYRPAIVVSKGDLLSKASARSVHGFNIIEFLRGASDLLVDVGGHPMAAGFTVETQKLLKLQEKLEKLAEDLLTEDHLVRVLKIDCELPLSMINQKLYETLLQLAPFGMGNPEPVFFSRRVVIEDMRLVGMDGRHIKFRLSQDGSSVFDAIAFGMGDQKTGLQIGKAIDTVYTIAEDQWNGNKKLQLKVKDIKPSKFPEVST